MEQLRHELAAGWRPSVPRPRSGAAGIAYELPVRKRVNRSSELESQFVGARGEPQT